MELRQIQYFVEVAKREHMTEAALALHVAQSAISRQIYKLEEELGVALFYREGRNVKLTPIGQIFLQYMERALSVINHGRREIEEFTDPKKGTIRIGFPSSLSAYTLPTAISTFRDAHPDVKFQLKQGSYHELVEAVVKGEINMALLGPVPEHENRVESAILFEEEMFALLPKKHRLANKSSVLLSDLKEEAFVLYPPGFILRDMIVEFCQKVGYLPNVSLEGEDIDAIKGLVSAGLGITIIPEVTLIENTPRATVKIPISFPRMTRSVGVVIPTERKLLPTEQLFYDFLKDLFPKSDHNSTSK